MSAAAMRRALSCACRPISSDPPASEEIKLKQSYKGLVALAIVLFVFSRLTEGFIVPIAYVSGASEALVYQYIIGSCSFVLTLLAARLIKQELIHGYIERSLNTKVPALIGGISTGFVIFFGICAILSLVFDRNISALIATLAGSACLLGFALKDFAVALFAGITLNLEKSYRVGDIIKVGDKQGTVDQITWRNTILASADRTTIIPNISLLKQVIQNLNKPESISKRSVELLIDYDVSVESVERILYAGALGASGVTHAKPPAVFATRMLPDGVQYEVIFFIANSGDAKRSEHAVIKNILESMRKADIMVAMPKRGSVEGVIRSKISNRSSDLFYLLQQVQVLRDFPREVCMRISELLIARRYPTGARVVQFGESRNSLFIVAEGIVKSSTTDQEDKLLEENFIATEFFGRRSLFGFLPQGASVHTQADTLLYEFNQFALQTLLIEYPELIHSFANNLAHIRWKRSQSNKPGELPRADEIQHLVELYRGQIEANYGGKLTALLA